MGYNSNTKRSRIYIYLRSLFLAYVLKKHAFKVVTCILGTPLSPTLSCPHEILETCISVPNWGTVFYSLRCYGRTTTDEIKVMT